MSLLGNLLWLILGGFVSALAWFFLGLLWCLTIVGIPIGVQCFKFASLSLMPFGRNVEFRGGGGSVLINILWLIFGGVEMALGFAILGVLFSITIIGIPFGQQYFKFAKLALMPLGSEVY